VFACGSMVRSDPLVCDFSALRAEKSHTIEKASTALPKAQHANCVCPNSNIWGGFATPNPTNA
jgi:hypothetical protein